MYFQSLFKITSLECFFVCLIFFSGTQAKREREQATIKKDIVYGSVIGILALLLVVSLFYQCRKKHKRKWLRWSIMSIRILVWPQWNCEHLQRENHFLPIEGWTDRFIIHSLQLKFGLEWEGRSLLNWW